MDKEKKSVKSVVLQILPMVILDVLLVGVILLTFAFFHHVLPAIQSERESQRMEEYFQQNQPLRPQPSKPAQSTTPDSTDTTHPDASDPGTTEPTLPKTEWQIKFADHFTDEVVITENSYTSPYVSITIDTVSYGSGWTAITYFVADIYVASLDNFKTYTAHNEMRYFSKQDVLEMDAACGAILSVSGDFYSYQKTGFLMRNGYLYKSDPTYCDICVLYDNGVLATYPKNGYDHQQILDQGAVQIWNFGPSLLDENGKVYSSYKVDSHIASDNPRSAIGYYEPGHYCLVVVDGRDHDYSVGMGIDDLAAIFEGLGCKVAYNLDGGGSAVMAFDDALYSKPSEDRDLSDIVIVVDGPPVQQEG